MYVCAILECKERVLIKNLQHKGFRVLVLEELPHQLLIYLFIVEKYTKIYHLNHF